MMIMFFIYSCKQLFFLFLFSICFGPNMINAQNVNEPTTAPFSSPDEVADNFLSEIMIGNYREAIKYISDNYLIVMEDIYRESVKTGVLSRSINPFQPIPLEEDFDAERKGSIMLELMKNSVGQTQDFTITEDIKFVKKGSIIDDMKAYVVYEVKDMKISTEPISPKIMVIYLTRNKNKEWRLWGW